MNNFKMLSGEELQKASWEDAKAFCEAQEREMFEEAKANGGYWNSAKMDLQNFRRYFEVRANDIEFSALRRSSCCFGLCVVLAIAQIVELLFIFKIVL